MTKHKDEFTPQAQDSKPPQVDQVAEQKRRAEEQEIAGRHKSQVDKQVPRHPPGAPRP